MSIDDLIKKIAAVEDAIKGDLSDVLRRAGNDVCALISDRVINTGKDSTGGMFTPYSTRKVPAFFYFNRSRSGGADSQVRRAAKNREGLSYSDFRRINNLPTSFKNFSFSNEMWRHFGVKRVEKSAVGWKVVIGGQTQAAEDKIRWMTAREKQDIVAPSKLELEIIKTSVEQFIKRSI